MARLSQQDGLAGYQFGKESEQEVRTFPAPLSVHVVKHAPRQSPLPGQLVEPPVVSLPTTKIKPQNRRPRITVPHIPIEALKVLRDQFDIM